MTAPIEVLDAYMEDFIVVDESNANELTDEMLVVKFLAYNKAGEKVEISHNIMEMLEMAKNSDETVNDDTWITMAYAYASQFGSVAEMTNLLKQKKIERDSNSKDGAKSKVIFFAPSYK